MGSALIDQAKRDQGFDSPMLHHRDYAHEFDILAETDTENFDRSLRDGLDLELYQPVYEMPFFDQ